MLTALLQVIEAIEATIDFATNPDETAKAAALGEAEDLLTSAKRALTEIIIAEIR